MNGFINNSNCQNFDFNSFNIFQFFYRSSIFPSLSPYFLLNNLIFTSPHQYYQNHNSFISFNDSEENFDDPKDFTFQEKDLILEQNNDIDKDIKENTNIKEETRKKVDNNITNTINNDNDNDNKNLIGKKKPRKHDKTAKDNIKRKIQVNYIKFLQNLLNQINIELLCNYENNENIKFFPLNYDTIKIVSKKYFDSLKKKTLGDIFKYNVSHKFKNYQNLNIQVYKEITDKSETIKNILDKTYLEFFDVYYLNKKTLNLSKYGLDKTIILSSDIGFFKDLLKKDDSDFGHSTEEDIYYQKRIKECIKSYFMRNDSPIFFVE